ncbi:hypothetical protein [Nocardioides astragali]|uniref:Uncharacterized protein n=1 Tax=Nocardioides astragali TaxID=1776736 RepID=A0ABW2MZZ8_9ACTN|nr:hypothetical protein [Nocardioides astragali]
MTASQALLRKDLGIWGWVLLAGALLLMLVTASKALGSTTDAVAAVGIAGASSGLGILVATLILREACLISSQRVENLNRVMNATAVAAGLAGLIDLPLRFPDEPAGFIAPAGALLSVVAFAVDVRKAGNRELDLALSTVSLSLVVAGVAFLFLATTSVDDMETWATRFACLAIGFAALACHLCWALLWWAGEIGEAAVAGPELPRAGAEYVGGENPSAAS